MHELIHVATNDEYAAAAVLFREYANWLGIDLTFQGFEEELQQLKSMYAAPLGGIILCRLNNTYAGCVAIRRQGDGIGELKRMYVQPSVQHKGIGQDLLLEALSLAKKCGYKKIRLDTLDHMEPAMALYKKNGFLRIPPYYHNPQETAVFFERSI